MDSASTTPPAIPDLGPERPTALPRSVVTVAGIARRLAPLAAAAVALLVLQGLGALSAIEDALGTMGFDPDRSILIAALMVDAAVAAVAVVPRGRSVLGPAAGVLAFVGLFGPTFARETSTALAPGPGQGRFDPAGWLISLVVLVAIAILCGATADVLAGGVRATLIRAARDLRRAVARQAPRRSFLRPAAVFGALAVTLAALPVFGDMVNYAPDVHLTSGGPAPVGLVGAGANGPTMAPVASADPFLRQALLAGDGGGPPTTPGRPWLAWRPSGHGTITQYRLPAPWTGGTSTTASIAVYTPPGYPDGARRYPVIYEVPWGVNSFVRGAHIQDALDGLITSGDVPASIVVFVSESGGPYPDSECINSADGREWFERFVTTTVVPFVDGRYATIASPRARALLGFSYGGFCAPMLLLRHPDIFSSSISFSGYFQAALRSGETPNAWRPYGGDQALIAATSPITEVAGLTAAQRASLFVVLSGSPTEAFFGPQYVAFAAAVHRAGVALALFPTPLGHSWTAVRTQLPAVLETLAARENALGVFTI